ECTEFSKIYCNFSRKKMTHVYGKYDELVHVDFKYRLSYYIRDQRTSFKLYASTRTSLDYSEGTISLTGPGHYFGVHHNFYSFIMVNSQNHAFRELGFRGGAENEIISCHFLSKSLKISVNWTHYAHCPCINTEQFNCYSFVTFLKYLVEQASLSTPTQRSQKRQEELINNYVIGLLEISVSQKAVLLCKYQLILTYRDFTETVILLKRQIMNKIFSPCTNVAPNSKIKNHKLYSGLRPT
ncbi:hypothetical protein HPG69_016670, partial [Diceros bicornis minor]